MFLNKYKIKTNYVYYYLKNQFLNINKIVPYLFICTSIRFYFSNKQLNVQSVSRLGIVGVSLYNVNNLIFIIYINS